MYNAACADQVIQSCQCSVGTSRSEVVADLVQLMATGEPSLVAGAAALLETVLRHDGDALPRLYITGAFFFALAYCGSNLLEIARLLRVSFPEKLLALSALRKRPDEGIRCSPVTGASTAGIWDCWPVQLIPNCCLPAGHAPGAGGAAGRDSGRRPGGALVFGRPAAREPAVRTAGTVLTGWTWLQ